MIDGKLIAAVEKVAQGARTVRPLKNIGFVDPEPAQLSPLDAQFVERVGHGALLLEQRFPCSQPFITGYCLMLHHHSPLLDIQPRPASFSQGGK